MNDYVHLIGAESVENAGREMSSAASDMIRAANIITDAVNNNREFLNDWLNRLEYVLMAKKMMGGKTRQPETLDDILQRAQEIEKDKRR